MPSITRIDFFPLPTQDADRATAFYRDTLGLEESEHSAGKPHAEFDLGGTTLMFFGSTADTGVCHMAFFADPDGNPLMLHGRHAPRD